MADIARISLTISPRTLDQAQSWLQQVARQQAWPTEAVFALRLSLEEALVNTLMHGFEQPPDARALICLALSSEPGFVTLEIRDNGKAFDPTARTPRPLAESLDEAVPGGHGLRLMRHYLHQLHYKHINGHNHLFLVAAIDQPQDRTAHSS